MTRQGCNTRTHQRDRCIVHHADDKSLETANEGWDRGGRRRDEELILITSNSRGVVNIIGIKALDAMWKTAETFGVWRKNVPRETVGSVLVDRGYRENREYQGGSGHRTHLNKNVEKVCPFCHV